MGTPSLIYRATPTYYSMVDNPTYQHSTLSICYYYNKVDQLPAKQAKRSWVGIRLSIDTRGVGSSREG